MYDPAIMYEYQIESIGIDPMIKQPSKQDLINELEKAKEEIKQLKGELNEYKLRNTD